MNWAKLRLPALAALVLCLASYVVFLEVEASENLDQQTGSSAIWDPAPGQLTQIEKDCGPRVGDYSRCFIAQMSDLGASSDALAFTQTYADLNHGAVALLKGLRPMDAVDVGYVSFPVNNGSGANQGWLLLNGTPAIINVDDLSLLPQAELAKDATYDKLRQRHKQITLFGGDRAPESAPVAEGLSDGGQQFDIDYLLKDGCRTCTVLGQASFRFDFDATGRLTEVKFLKVTPANH